MGGKRKINLKIDCEEVEEMEKSIFSEIGHDGLRFFTAKFTHRPLRHDEYQRLTNSFFASNVKLGRGAACIVQQGTYSPLNIPVAIKSINVYDQQKRHQIMNDIKILLANIIDEERNCYKCNFIVTLYGAYYDQGKVKVILELMDAGSLENIISAFLTAQVEPNIDESILAKIALQMLCGLTYLHSKNLLHRDIKPANVLLNSKGQVKLSDFGISRELSQQTQFSKTSVGTRSYMSPQRIQGKRYSFKSDVWGIGLILYELATSRFPYDSRSEFDLRRDFQNQDLLNCRLITVINSKISLIAPLRQAKREDGVPLNYWDINGY